MKVLESMKKRQRKAIHFPSNDLYLSLELSQLIHGTAISSGDSSMTTLQKNQIHNNHIQPVAAIGNQCQPQLFMLGDDTCANFPPAGHFIPALAPAESMRVSSISIPTTSEKYVTVDNLH